ncbi:unnamed protein product [Phaedon cochleariae]|uniref:Uncharacterized protein n=1 Tax=Phaedon cochleariae TaxID=80249 RepID=A0A9N9SC12_PHACE|nr:unnamed protein product [Phaedon cochleariae]
MSDTDVEDEEKVNAGEGGESKEIYPYGEYEGGRDEQLERHGFGSALLPNGDVYEGEYYHGKRHGRGMYCFKNGSRYTGTWSKGLKHGEGEFLYPDGSRYQGEWKKDLKHDQVTFLDGSSKNFISFSTLAILPQYSPSIDPVYNSVVPPGIVIGQFIRKISHSADLYTGTWRKGLKHGKGEFLYPDGSRYQGEWKKDLKHGQGSYFYVNGDLYEGCWYKGLRHGLGTYTYKAANVTHYGTWKDGRMTGPGILNYPYYSYVSRTIETPYGEIQGRTTVKFLGIHIDEKLDWKNHIHNLNKKLCSATFAIYTIRKNIGIESAITVYYAYFYSLVQYGIEFWGHSVDVNSTFVIQKRALRAICGIKRIESCRSHFERLKILTITNLYLYRLSLLAFKKKHELEQFTDVHNHDTRNKNKYIPPQFNYTVNRKGPLYMATKTFNHLPSSITEIVSLNIFKNKVKQFFQTHVYYDTNQFFNAHL